MWSQWQGAIPLWGRAEFWKALHVWMHSQGLDIWSSCAGIGISQVVACVEAWTIYCAVVCLLLVWFIRVVLRWIVAKGWYSGLVYDSCQKRVLNTISVWSPCSSFTKNVLVCLQIHYRRVKTEIPAGRTWAWVQWDSCTVMLTCETRSFGISRSSHGPPGKSSVADKSVCQDRQQQMGNTLVTSAGSVRL